jgi:hypothetical protein
LKAFPFPEGDVSALRFSRDGKLLIAGGGVGGASGKVVGFEVATGKRTFELGDELDAVLAVDVSPDNSLVALGGPGRVVKILRTANGELVATLRKHTDWIFALAFSPDGLLLASGDRFGGLQVWEAASGKEFHTLRGHVGSVHALGWSADSDRLLSAGQDGSPRFWDMHTGAIVAKWDGGTGGILAVDCDAADRVVCGGRDGKLAVWDSPDHRSQELSMPDEVVKVAFSHDSSRVIAGDAAGNIAVFRASNGELASRFTLPQSPAVVRAPRSSVQQTKPSLARDTAGPLVADLAAAEDAVRRATAELEEMREALEATESAATAAEKSLKKLRSSAAKLARAVSARDSAVKEAERHFAELRAKAEATDLAIDLEAQRDRLQQRLTEKRSLLESARGLCERLAQSAENSPADAGLQTAANLAAKLWDSLATDVATTAEELDKIRGNGPPAVNANGP